MNSDSFDPFFLKEPKALYDRELAVAVLYVCFYLLLLLEIEIFSFFELDFFPFLFGMSSFLSIWISLGVLFPNLCYYFIIYIFLNRYLLAVMEWTANLAIFCKGLLSTQSFIV